MPATATRPAPKTDKPKSRRTKIVRLAEYHTPELQASLLEELRRRVKGRSAVVISLEGVERISHGLLELWLAFTAEIKAKGGAITVREVEDPLKRQLQRLGAEALLSD